MDVTELRQAAADAVQQWAKHNAPEEATIKLVNEYMELSGANNKFGGEDAIKQRRRICANEVLLNCIAPLSPEELSRAKNLAYNIANNRYYGINEQTAAIN